MKKIITFLTLFVISFLLISCDYRKANVELRCPSSSYSRMKCQLKTEACYLILDKNVREFDGADGLSYSIKFIDEKNIVVTAINCNDSTLKSYYFEIDNSVNNEYRGIGGDSNSEGNIVVVK